MAGPAIKIARAHVRTRAHTEQVFRDMFLFVVELNIYCISEAVHKQWITFDALFSTSGYKTKTIHYLLFMKYRVLIDHVLTLLIPSDTRYFIPLENKCSLN